MKQSLVQERDCSMIPVFLSMTGSLGLAAAAPSLGRAGCRACGALCWASSCDRSTRVPGDAAEDSVFTWPENETDSPTLGALCAPVLVD